MYDDFDISLFNCTEMDTIENNSQQQPEVAANGVVENENVISNTDGQVIDDENLDETDAVDQNAQSEAMRNLSKAELVEKAKNILASSDNLQKVKTEIEAVKQNFYRLFNQEKEDDRAKFIEEGGAAEDYVALTDPLEAELKDVLAEYKKRRQAEIQKEEAEKQANLDHKKTIILNLQKLLNDPEDFNKKFPEFQKIQEEWKSVGLVPASEVAKIRENYQSLVEDFYDNLKINNELRDYDFRKNLEAKTKLCEEAEKLANENDVVSAFKTLQLLHEQWSELGPVSKEHREEIWNRFKAASTVINKKHNDYFDALKAQENDNLEKKTKICEQIEAIDVVSIASMKEWQEKSDVIKQLQQDWRKIGFAPKKFNVSIYERFRSACDKFFNAKSEYLKGVKAVLQENLEKKVALCVKAEALKDCDESKDVTEQLKELQKDWKTIGAVPKKQADAVWNRFNAACDTYFKAKKDKEKARKNGEVENLNKKKDIIEKIQTLDVASDNKTAEANLRQLIDEYASVGHVPFKEKDALYKSYKAAIDEKFDAIKRHPASRNSSDFPKNDRARLLKQKASLESDIATYENNMGFLANSKSSSSLKDSLEKKLQEMRQQLQVVKNKINELENNDQK